MSAASKSQIGIPPDAGEWTALSATAGVTPLYHRITETLMREIDAGRLPPGSMLPPEIELAQRFGVSRHTMRAGIAALVRAGVLERRRGKGSVVRRPPLQQSLSKFYSVAEEMRAQGAKLRTQVLARGRLHTADELAVGASQALGIEQPEQIGMLHRLRLVDGERLR